MTTHTDAPADPYFLCGFCGGGSNECQCHLHPKDRKPADDELDGLRVTEEICADRIARKAADDLVVMLLSVCVDYDGSSIPDGGEPRVFLSCGEIRQAAARIRSLEEQVKDARRRRDAWRKKAEGYDAVCLALREKVGSPWPPHMSRLLWAGIAAAEKTRADRAEAQRDEAVGLHGELLSAAASVFNKLNNGRYATRGELSDKLRGPIDRSQAFFDSLKEGRHGQDHHD